jgi:hypothetical protein
MTPEMQSSGVRYSGTKTLTAWPMTRGQYNAYRTWTPPEGEDQTTAGYLVEYADGGAANDSRHADYISWSPADVFERSYKRQPPAMPADGELPNRGPRITPADIEANIASEHFFTAGQGAAHAASFGAATSSALDALGLLTFCVLVLRNGFTVTGESACASPENFDAEIGQRIARANAVQKIWPLMGYQLRTALAGTPPPASNAFVAPGCEQFGESSGTVSA